MSSNLTNISTRWMYIILFIVFGIRFSQSILANESSSPLPFPQPRPSDLGLEIPDDIPKPGNGQRVLLNSNANPARVYLEFKDRKIVMLDDGRLVSIKNQQAVVTDRPFVPVRKPELTKRLLEEFPGFRVKKTNRYLYVSNANPKFVDDTSRILETMHPAIVNFCRKRGASVTVPEFPLVVVAFETKDQFQTYRKMPSGVVAYYNTLSNRIVIYQRSDVEIAPQLEWRQTVSTIAHEGVHQVLPNIGVQHRLSRWPDWFSEGLAEYFAPTRMSEQARWKGIGHSNDFRQRTLDQFYEKLGAEHAHGQLIRNTIQAKSLNSFGYATSWGIVHYLDKRRREQFTGFMADISKSKPLQNVDGEQLFKKHFGSDYADIEKRMQRHLEHASDGIDPTHFLTHYVVAFHDKRDPVVTTSKRKVRQLQERHKSRIRIQAFPNKGQADKCANRIKSR